MREQLLERRNGRLSMMVPGFARRYRQSVHVRLSSCFAIYACSISLDCDLCLYTTLFPCLLHIFTIAQVEERSRQRTDQEICLTKYVPNLSTSYLFTKEISSFPFRRRAIRCDAKIVAVPMIFLWKLICTESTVSLTQKRSSIFESS
jgi:hypothetical protein